jgi:hypothetical protein
MTRNFPSLLLVATLLAVVLGGSVTAAAQERTQRARVRGAEPLQDPSSTYEFLVNKGKLLFEYGRFRESAEAFMAACATDQGQAEAVCWQRLATVAERAGLIGVAIDSWARTAATDPNLAEASGREAERLRSAFGAVRFSVPVGRRLPSRPLPLSHEGLLIDPQLKKYLKKFLALTEVEGISEHEVWLPVGRYAGEGIAFEIAPGAVTEFALSGAVVPYRPVSFGLADRPPARSVPGPWELAIAFQLSSGNAPGDGIGVAPIGLGGALSIGRRFGPLRVEARLRWGGTATASIGEDAEGLRQGTAWHVLGQADVGVDLNLRPYLYLTPHFGLVGGSLGELLLSCLAEQKASSVVYSGECRLGAAAVGGQAGADLWWVPVKTEGRVVFRLGVWGEALGGWVLTEAGETLGGGLDTSVLRIDSHQFTWIRVGLDVGTSFRF